MPIQKSSKAVKKAVRSMVARKTNQEIDALWKAREQRVLERYGQSLEDRFPSERNREKDRVYKARIEAMHMVMAVDCEEKFHKEFEGLLLADLRDIDDYYNKRMIRDGASEPGFVSAIKPANPSK